MKQVITKINCDKCGKLIRESNSHKDKEDQYAQLFDVLLGGQSPQPYAEINVIGCSETKLSSIFLCDECWKKTLDFIENMEVKNESNK